MNKKIEELKAGMEHVAPNQRILSFKGGEWIIGSVKEASELLKEVKSRKIALLLRKYQELGNYNNALELFGRAENRCRRV